MLPLGDKNFLEEFEMNKSISLLAATACATSFAAADTYTIDLAGAESWGYGANPNGNILEELPALSAGEFYVLESISWDNVEFETFGGSWASEVRFLISGDFGAWGLGGLSDDTSGGGVFGPSSGSTDLIGSPMNGESTFLAFGIYDSYDDFGGAEANAQITAGTATLTYSVVPAPGALALLGLAGMGRRRRS